MATALILVDLQHDFLPGGALAVPAGDEVIQVANRLIPHFDLVVATQDWHPPNHGSFADNHPGKVPGEQVELNGIQQVLWPVHCVQESHGAALAQGLIETDRYHVFRKGSTPRVDSYSGFFDNDRRHSTGLESFLREKNVNRAYIMGLATDYCVKFTVLDCCRLGFDTTVIADGCRGVNLAAGDEERALEEMRAAGARVVQAAEVVKRAQR